MSLNIQALPEVTEFTTEMLTKNFVAIAQNAKSVDRWLEHLQGHVTDLIARPMEVVVKAPKRGKLIPIVTALGVGYVAYQTGRLVSDVRKTLNEDKRNGKTEPGPYESTVLKQNEERSTY